VTINQTSDAKQHRECSEEERDSGWRVSRGQVHHQWMAGRGRGGCMEITGRGGNVLQTIQELPGQMVGL